MAGLSSRLVLWRAFSQSVILLYLFEEKASMLIIIPSAISSVIEVIKYTNTIFTLFNYLILLDLLLIEMDIFV